MLPIREAESDRADLDPYLGYLPEKTEDGKEVRQGSDRSISDQVELYCFYPDRSGRKATRRLGSLAFEEWKPVRLLPTNNPSRQCIPMLSLIKRLAGVEDVTKSIVGHVQTTLARQAYNIDEVSPSKVPARALT